ERFRLVDDRHRHDSVLFHSISNRARQLTDARDLRFLRHYGSYDNWKEIWPSLDQPAQIARGQYPVDPARSIDDDGDPAPLRNHDDCLPHGITICQDRQVVVEHDLLDFDYELSPERPAGVNSGEILSFKALFLEQSHRERVADDQCRRRARRRSEV